MEHAASPFSSKATRPLLPEDSVRLFLMPAPLPWWKHGSIKTAPLVLLAGVLIFGGLNAEALLRITSAASQNAGTAPVTSATPNPVATPETVTTKPVVVAVATPVPTPTPNPPTIPENTLALGDLGISVPITWNVPLDGTDTPLRNGVVHISGTAQPGQTGTVTIAGHSSYYPWGKGNYKTIFAPLVKAKEGQIIEINYKNTAYRYKIVHTHEVAPTDLSVLKADGTAQLRLITCTPVGTSLRRLIVDAVQIEPNPSGNQSFASTDFTGQLPSDQ